MVSFSIFRGLTVCDMHKIYISVKNSIELPDTLIHNIDAGMRSLATAAMGFFDSVFSCSHPIGMSRAHSSEYAFS